MSDTVTVLICSYLEPDLVERIRAVDSRVGVIDEPGLIPSPRYAADHVGAPFSRTEPEERRWRELLARADVLFDYDRTNEDVLPDLAPGVRWIQHTSAGIGQLIARTGYARRMPDTVFTTAAGIHAQPLAEFAVLSILAFSRGLLHAQDLQRRRTWERFAATDVEGRTLLVFGAGGIGRAVARVGRCLGMRVIGIKRRVGGARPEELDLDEVHGPDSLHDLLPRADYLVLAAPHTPETEHAIGAAELQALVPGAVIVNVGRGRLIDEPALIEALRSGRLGGAALDVFEREPLPGTSPLWDMPNVILFPHSASTSDRENRRLVDLFCDNLRRFLDGRPLRNVLDTAQLY